MQLQVDACFLSHVHRVTQVKYEVCTVVYMKNTPRRPQIPAEDGRRTTDAGSELRASGFMQDTTVHHHLTTVQNGPSSDA